MSEIIYPKQINRVRQTQNDNQCFFAMPFSEEYTNLYDTLVLYMEKAGYKCVRVDNNLSASVPIINLILNGIASSQYVIVDISEPNANVFYELGITHTVKDAENVFIIKEISSSTPFDIQHLQYISYNRNNLKDLANNLVKRVEANQYKNAFKKILSVKQLINYDEIDGFVSYFSELFSEEFITVYTELLENHDVNSYIPNHPTEDAIWEYDKVLQREIAIPASEKYIPYLFSVFFEMLLSCHKNVEIQKYVDEFLHMDEYSNLQKLEICSYQTDLAIKFAENSKLTHISVKWIIEYFQRSKSTKVDLNRYKLEGFLLKSNTEKVNEYIVNALLSENNYIREHIADIAGEKRLYIAEDNLITQLKRETNLYTTASIFEALGKIQSTKAIPTIIDWLKTNADTAIKNQNYFVLKHARNSLFNIGDKNILQEFDNNYYDILKKTNII